MYKNVSGQSWKIFAFDRTDNTPKTGDSANITAKIKLDDAAAAATDQTNPTEIEDGYYQFELTQAETNADELLLLPESSTSDIQVIAIPAALWTADGGWGGGASGSTGPDDEPVSLTDAKLHLRLATTTAEAAAYTTEDSWLSRNIISARRQVENWLGRALISQTKTWYLERWPDKNYIELPYPTLQSATCTYRLEDDDDYDNSLSIVDTDIVSQPGRLILQPGEIWPSGSLYPNKPIKIVMVCGYGDAASDVPEDIRNAMLLMIEDAYNNRGEIVLGVSVSRIQGAIDSLLYNYVIHTEFE